MTPYIKNILGGIRLATFMRCERQDFVISWGLLIAAFVTSFALQFVIEAAVFYKGGEINEYSWYRYQLSAFSLILLAGILIAVFFKESEKVLNVAVMFYYSFLALLVPYYLLYADYPDWMTKKMDLAIENMILIWSFLVMYRIVGINFPPVPMKQIKAALLAPLCIYILNSEVYLSHFFYSNDDEEETEVLSAFERLTDEEIFTSQPKKLEKEFAKLKASKKGVVDMYGVSVGSYSYQDVFMKEARFVTEQLENILKMQGRVVTLINNEDTYFDTPAASVTNLEATLSYIGSKMQRNEDILLLYMTSHGSPAGLSVYLGSAPGMLLLSGERVAEALKKSGIKNKVIIISACYSGSLIETLKDDNTMIITASANNKQSYGCSDDADLTFFADGYFKQGLQQTTNLEKAYEIAKKKIEEREAKETLGPPSDPQIYIGKNIQKVLAKYKPVPLTK